MKKVMSTVFVALCLMVSGQACALNILLTNDDGFETANIQALYQTLKKAGNDVVISAPAENNSGVGGNLPFFKPVTPLSENSRFGTIKAGAPGVGTEPDDSNIHYVNSTPVASLLYGLDVVAQQHWGKQPDLIISGPNNGANDGYINASSGTENCAYYGINRGIPAIAVSYENPTAVSYQKLSPGDYHYQLANIVLSIVNQLKAKTDSGGRLLPPGVGLNVNVPLLKAGQTPAMKFTYMGVATDYQPVFYSKLSNSAFAQNVFQGHAPDAPGISFVVTKNGVGVGAPAGVVLPKDTDPDSETNALAAGAITISTIEGLPAARRSNVDAVKIKLHNLVGSSQGG